MHWQEGRIDRLIKGAQEYLEANTKEWVVSLKDLIVNTFRGIIFPMVVDFIWKQPKVEKKEVSKEVKDESNKSVHDQD